MQALGDHYRFKLFSKNAVEDCFFDDVDMVAFPGGFGDADSFATILKANQRRVTEFVQQGGRYLGICMGAYWAGSHYFNILNGVDAVQYITQPGADTRRPHAKNIKINWNRSNTEMFFYDGCALVGNGEFNTIATYANGDPMAIIQNRIGLIGCHPESEQFWYDSYSWMRSHWHHCQHHQLLLEFVDQLISSN
jgi:glutamine amidotransferase-like uncharacterized protein